MKKMTFDQICEKRRSIRNFLPQIVPDEIILKVIETATTAPSSYNEQPWRLIIADRQNILFNQILSTLSEWNQKWAANTSHLIVTLAKKSYSHNNDVNIHAWYDVGQFVAFFCLKAMESGIYTHQMGGFSPDKLKKALKISDQFDVVTVIGFGYEDTNQVDNEKNTDFILTPRVRKDINQLVSINKYPDFK